MAILNQKRILNLIPKTSAPVTIHVSQGDVGTEIEFTLVKGDELFVNTGSLSASVHGVREDGANFGVFTCTLSGSSVKFPLHAEMTAVKGSAIAEIVLVDSQGNKVGSSNFGIMVEESVFPLGVTYDNDVSVYESILAYAQTIPAQVQGEIADLENDVNSLNEALAQEVANRNAAIAVETGARENSDNLLGARIDQIIAPSGEAPSAAEVLDARIGADGLTYGSLGEANRAQFKGLGEVISTGCDFGYANAKMDIKLESGKLNSSTGAEEASQYYVRSSDFFTSDDIIFIYSERATSALLLIDYLADGTYYARQYATDNKYIYRKAQSGHKYRFCYSHNPQESITDPLSCQQDLTIFLKESTAIKTLKSQTTGVMASMADEYDETEPYSFGNIVFYSNRLYFCISTISTAEAFTSSHWYKLSLDEFLSIIRAELGGVQAIEKNLLPSVMIIGGINSTGTDNNSSSVVDSYHRSFYIRVFKNDVIEYTKLRGTTLNIISYYDLNGVYTDGVTGASSALSGTYTVPNDGYIRICDRNTELYSNSTCVLYSQEGENLKTIANNKDNIMSLVNKNFLPSFWESYLEEKIPALRLKDALIGNNGDSFIFVTDVHVPRNRMRSPIIFNRLFKETAVKKLFNGGDSLDISTGESGIGLKNEAPQGI